MKGPREGKGETGGQEETGKAGCPPWGQTEGDAALTTVLRSSRDLAEPPHMTVSSVDLGILLVLGTHGQAERQAVDRGWGLDLGPTAPCQVSLLPEWGGGLEQMEEIFQSSPP